MTTSVTYRVLPPDPKPREVQEIVNSLRAGRFNSGGTLSFSTGTTATSLSDARAHPTVRLYLTPLNEAAAREFGTWWLSARTKGAVTINHNTSSEARNFAYDLIG